jgi:hypothetical protein
MWMIFIRSKVYIKFKKFWCWWYCLIPWPLLQLEKGKTIRKTYTLREVHPIHSGEGRGEVITNA